MYMSRAWRQLIPTHVEVAGQVAGTVFRDKSRTTSGQGTIFEFFGCCISHRTKAACKGSGLPEWQLGAVDGESATKRKGDWHGGTEAHQPCPAPRHNRRFLYIYLRYKPCSTVLFIYVILDLPSCVCLNH